MKTLAILLASLLSLNLTACATDDEPLRTGGPGLRPGYKPELTEIPGPNDTQNEDRGDFDESIDLGSIDDNSHPRYDDLDNKLDGKVGEWAEDIVIGGRLYTIVHVDGRVVLVDAEGRVLRDEPGGR